MCNACIKDLEWNIQKELEFPNKSTGTDKLLEAIEGKLGLEEANPKKTCISPHIP